MMTGCGCTVRRRDGEGHTYSARCNRPGVVCEVCGLSPLQMILCSRHRKQLERTGLRVRLCTALEVLAYKNKGGGHERSFL